MIRSGALRASSHASSAPTASKVAVERFDDALCSDGHFVDSTPREIDELFRMSEGKAATVTGVTGVGRGRGVSASERFGQRRITDCMPAAGWNGKFQGVGNGGWAATRDSDMLVPGLPHWWV